VNPFVKDSEWDNRESFCSVCKCLRERVRRGIDPCMAFIVLRRSRNTRSYYLVESYRDMGKVRRRTLCYLGREQDGTDSLAKARAHWEQVKTKEQRELRIAKGEGRQVIRRRLAAITTRLGIITQHLQALALAEAERQKRQQQAEELVYWQTFDQLRRSPAEENAKAAKRAYLFLAKRYHPDQGGSHNDFLRVKDAYDRANAVWRRMAA
jgi:hypothetical protein